MSLKIGSINGVACLMALLCTSPEKSTDAQCYGCVVAQMDRNVTYSQIRLVHDGLGCNSFGLLMRKYQCDATNIECTSTQSLKAYLTNYRFLKLLEYSFCIFFKYCDVIHIPPSAAIV